MGSRPHRGKLEHRVKRRDFEHADVGHAEHVGDRADRRFGYPTFLLLRAPQQRDDGAGLTAFGVFRDLPLRPGQIGGREGKGCGLVVVKAAALNWRVL